MDFSFCDFFVSFGGTFPPNCSAAFVQSVNEQDKLKVIRLRVGGCDRVKIKKLVDTFPNLYSLDISQSVLTSLYSMHLEHKQLVKFNASHNKIEHFPYEFFSKRVESMEKFNQIR